MGAGASSSSVYDVDSCAYKDSPKRFFTSEIDEFASNEFINPFQRQVFKSFIELSSDYSEQEFRSLQDPLMDDSIDRPTPRTEMENAEIRSEGNYDHYEKHEIADDGELDDDNQMQMKLKMTKKQYAYTKGEYIKGLMNHLHTAVKASNLANKCQFVELTDVESALYSAYDSGQTPLILDTSPDDRVGVFFSYQPDVITFEAKAMVVNGSHGKALADNMDELRRHLVAAMKYGKTLHIKLQNCAVDFQNIWNDSSASTRLIHTKYDCYKDINTSLKGSWKRLLKQDKASTVTEDGKTKLSTMSVTEAENVYGIVDSHADQRAFFPIVALLRSGQTLHEFQDYWVPRLYTEDEIKPHKNFAVCKPGFKVFLSCAMTLKQAAEELFGYTLESNYTDDDNSHININNQNNSKSSFQMRRLPDIDNFSLISVVELSNNDTNDNEDNKHDYKEEKDETEELVKH